MHLTVKKFVTGPIETNTYVVGNESKACIIIDPSHGCDTILEHINTQGLSCVAIILTHGHFDHFLGLEEILKVFPDTGIWIHHEEVTFLSNPDFNGSYMIGMEVSYTGPVKEIYEGFQEIGGFPMQVFHVPGHSPGGIVLYMEPYCFSGDTLFAGSIGRFDFPGCDGGALIANIREKLLTLPDETVVCPGHGGRTTVGREKKRNPFLQ